MPISLHARHRQPDLRHPAPRNTRNTPSELHGRASPPEQRAYFSKAYSLKTMPAQVLGKNEDPMLPTDEVRRIAHSLRVSGSERPLLSPGRLPGGALDPPPK